MMRTANRPTTFGPPATTGIPDVPLGHTCVRPRAGVRGYSGRREETRQHDGDEAEPDDRPEAADGSLSRAEDTQ